MYSKVRISRSPMYVEYLLTHLYGRHYAGNKVTKYDGIGGGLASLQTNNLNVIDSEFIHNVAEAGAGIGMLNATLSSFQGANRFFANEAFIGAGTFIHTCIHTCDLLRSLITLIHVMGDIRRHHLEGRPSMVDE